MVCFPNPFFLMYTFSLLKFIFYQTLIVRFIYTLSISDYMFTIYYAYWYTISYITVYINTMLYSLPLRRRCYHYNLSSTIKNILSYNQVSFKYIPKLMFPFPAYILTYFTFINIQIEV